MPEHASEWAGWLPALIFPTATFLQLWNLIQRKDSRGVSALSWGLFGLANLGLYVYTEKYQAWPSIIGLLLTAVLDFLIVAGVFFYRQRPD